MTIIADYVDGDIASLACDSQGSTHSVCFNYGNKIIKKNNYFVGVSGSYRVMDIIKESKELPKEINCLKDLHLFRDTLMKTVIKKGLTIEKSTNKDGETINHQLYILIATTIGLVSLDCDYQLHVTRNGYYATGAGENIALGSLFNSHKNKDKKNSFNIAKLAAQAANAHSPWCGGSIYTASVILNKRKNK